MTQVFLVSPTGSNQTFTSPDSWNNSNNSIEVIGAGGAGAHGASTTTGGGGGAGGGYNKITNFTFATPGVTTATYRIGAGGTAAGTLTGGDTWFNSAAFPTTGTAVGAKGGPGPASSTTATGGTAVATTSFFPTTSPPARAGGSGGNGASATAGGGGGGAGGPNGAGSAGSGTAGGAADGGTVAGGSAGNPGTNHSGTEFDSTHGCGSGGGGSNASGGTGGAGGLYGGGGGGGSRSNGTGGAGAQGIIVLTWVPTYLPQVNPITDGGYQAATSNRALANSLIHTQATSFAVPGPVSAPPFGWHPQTNYAVAVAQAMQGTSLVPFNTQTAPVVTPPWGWQSQSPDAAPVAKAIQGHFHFPLNVAIPDAPTSLTVTTPSTNNQPTFSVGLPFGHGAPRDAQAGDTIRIEETAVFTFFYTITSGDIAANTATVPWGTGLSGLSDGVHFIHASIERGIPAKKSAFTNASPLSINTTVLHAWWSQLSTAAPVAKAQQGSSFVPFNTAQAAATPTPNGWFGQTNSAANTTKAQSTQATSFAVPPSVAPPAVTPGQFGWYSQLSKAAPLVPAKPGSTFVPFNTTQFIPSTAQTVPLIQDSSATYPTNVYYQALFNPLKPAPAAPSNTVNNLAWQQPLSVAPATPKVNSSQPVLPFTTTVTPTGWYQPLSTAVKTASPVQTQPVWTPLASQTISFAWQQPLSKAAPVAQAQQGSIFLPLAPPVIPAPIAGMAWYSQLGSVPPANTVAPQGMSFVPFDTVQVTPPPPPPSTQPDFRPFLVTMGRLSCIG